MSWKTRYHLQERRKKRGKKLSRLQKVTWWLLPISTHHHHFGSIPYSTGHGSKKKKNSYHFILHRFKLCTTTFFFFLILLRKAHTLAWEIIALGPSPFWKSYLLYTLDPQPTWDYSQNGTGGGRKGKGEGMHIPNKCALRCALCQSQKTEALDDIQTVSTLASRVQAEVFW